MAVAIVVLSACDGSGAAEVNRLNEKSYAFRYRDLDSTKFYAQQSLRLADSLGIDRAEGLNNLAFVCLTKMQNRQAARLLNEVIERSDNEVELLVADVQLMRLCQRQSRNKDFYNFRERAERRMRRIKEEAESLTPHLRKRMIYAETEFHIVSSSYFYYVGLWEQMIAALGQIVPNGDIEEDPGQLLSYWYNIGAGGILVEGTEEEIAQEEFDYLMRCYLQAREHGMVFWEAQAMQSMSEHLQNKMQRQRLIRDNLPAMKYINVDQMPDSLLAGNLAQRAYNAFERYGDVYQMAGANRTLAECFWQIGDYRSALACLERALNSNKAIFQAPDLIASIREQLSLVYSAVDDKVNSDLNRNIYLDLQEETRQDRLLEARASQLDESSAQLNVMLYAVIFMIGLTIILLFVFYLMRRRNDARFSLESLLGPLEEWRKKSLLQQEHLQEKYESIEEQKKVVQLHLSNNKRRNLEQRAKIQLVNNIMPFIDRMMNEVRRLQAGGDSEAVRRQRYEYIAELTDTINDYNNVLTQWIQMRQGEVSLKIESFALQSLFDTVSHGSMSFRMKGIELDVKPTTSVVKADKTLTLFMINTMADNARKFTAEGGRVVVRADETDSYVEISIEDNGCGMTDEQLAHIFDRTYTGGHGYGLKNCNGIIEKYKKISRIFSVCVLRAESRVGEGSRLFFRLPRGVARAIVALLMLSGLGSMPVQGAQMFGFDDVEVDPEPMSATASAGRNQAIGRATKASIYADSAYFANLNANYLATLRYADSCHKYLLPTDTAILLDISNETAVAALALHDWALYEKNNKVYTRLFREASADNSLPGYVRTMQKSESNKNVAIVLLVLLLGIIVVAYYFLYYRYQQNYQFCIDRINAMNRLLLGDLSDGEKLRGIRRLDDFDRYDMSGDRLNSLRRIVGQIEDALHASIGNASLQATSIEMAEDELRRLQMDNYQLHVSNSVLDNCLSTLKHETMYYPSRIRQLVDGTDQNLDGIAELASYYKELYQILSLQAVHQLVPLRLATCYTDYLFDILRKLNQGEQPGVRAENYQDKYVRLEVDMHRYAITPEECRSLFAPDTKDLKFLICRQIVREMGEATNLRACGMIAKQAPDGTARIAIIMPRRYFRQQGTMAESHHTP